MTLKADQGVVYVHLGPQWYFDEQDLAIKVGITVEVTAGGGLRKSRSTSILGTGSFSG
jgi:hypothetical protein